MNMRSGGNTNHGERGTAIILVVAVLFLIVAFLAANTRTLRSLRGELQLVNERQLHRYGAAAVTNTVPRAPLRPAVPAPEKPER